MKRSQVRKSRQLVGWRMSLWMLMLDRSKQRKMPFALSAEEKRNICRQRLMSDI